MTFAEKIKIECFSREITPTSLCAQLGFSHGAFTYWRSKGATPNLESIGKFAEYFGISVSELMKGVDGVPMKEGEKAAFVSPVVSAPSAPADSYSPQEKEIIEIYRSLPVRKQFEFLASLLSLQGEGGAV